MDPSCHDEARPEAVNGDESMEGGQMHEGEFLELMLGIVTTLTQTSVYLEHALRDRLDD